MGKKLLHKIRKTIKNLLHPVYHSYVGHKLFSLIEWLTGYKIERHRICKLIGYYPNLKNPQSFNEKILWKKIYDRNPLLPIITDKYKVREYLKNVLGEKQAEKILIPLLFITDDPESIPFNTLLEEYVIKPNHASGKFILAENIAQQKRYTVIENHKTTILPDCKSSRNEILKICKRWLSMSHGFYMHEWAYQKIKRKIIIEKLLRNSSRKIPDDYRFFVFNGKCHLIAVISDKFNNKSREFYTPKWKYLNIQGHTRHIGYRKKPENLKPIIDLVELLGKPFDFIRVDLYLVDNHIYFSELTNYAGSGRNHYNPISFDFELGSKWKVVPRYWKQSNFL